MTALGGCHPRYIGARYIYLSDVTGAASLPNASAFEVHACAVLSALLTAFGGGFAYKITQAVRC